MSQPEPDLELAGLRLSVAGWAFPLEADPWSQNTLRYSAVVDTPISTVRFDGLMSAFALKTFHDELSIAHSSLTGRATLEVLEETTFSAVVEMGSLGHAEIKVAVIADYGMERHDFVFETDQTFLAKALRQLRVLAASYPPVATVYEAETPRPKVASKAGNLSKILDAIFGKRVAD